MQPCILLDMISTTSLQNSFWSEMSTRLFIYIHGLAQASTSKKPDAEKKEKDDTFKAKTIKEALPSPIEELKGMEKLLPDFAITA